MSHTQHTVSVLFSRREVPISQNGRSYSCLLTVYILTRGVGRDVASQLLFTKCILRGAKSVAYEDRDRNRERDRNRNRNRNRNRDRG